MKLRFQNDSMRLRLSQSEVARLKETGRVENTVAIAPGQALVYSIETAPVGSVAATLEGGRIRIVVPVAAAHEWIDSDQTGIEGVSSSLQILVEKDFQCLHKSSPSDADAFPNPLRDSVG